MDFVIRDDSGRIIGELSPEKRYYRSSQMPLSEAAILPRMHRDIYLALGEPQDNSQKTWSLRLQIKPYIRFIWLGALVMAMAALFVWFDKRHKAGGPS